MNLVLYLWILSSYHDARGPHDGQLRQPFRLSVCSLAIDAVQKFELEIQMNSLMNERNLSNRWPDLFHTPVAIVHSQHALPTTLRETTRKPLWREWVAHRTWEDDGGSVGHDRRRNGL